MTQAAAIRKFIAAVDRMTARLTPGVVECDYAVRITGDGARCCQYITRSSRVMDLMQAYADALNLGFTVVTQEDIPDAWQRPKAYVMTIR